MESASHRIRWQRISAGVALMAAGLSVSTVTAVHAATDASVSAGATIPASAFGFVDQMRSCTHHVATTGSDASMGTSLPAAWRTPGRALALLQPGQTACVHAGSYSVATLDPARSGTASAPIALVAAPGEIAPSPARHIGLEHVQLRPSRRLLGRARLRP